MLHEGILRLFRNRPELAAELLAQRPGVELPAWHTSEVRDAHFA
jgi:hypothetical protein